MKRAFAYLIFILAIYCVGSLLIILGKIQIPHEYLQLSIYCGICGGVGGITYCLRGIYLNACVHKRWDDDWLPWYFIRPIVSFICGVVSFLFLKAGLIVLEARQEASASNLAFYALAFIAGLNVDRFIEKIEELAQAAWGIRRSRTSEKEEN
jgi:H+/Cl- antiporter ClcA